MIAVAMASLVACIPTPPLSFSILHGVAAPDRVDSKSGARARARTTECRGRVVGQRKEPA